LGRPTPSGRPEAELWLGAHPSAPSRILRSGAWQSLLEVIERAPEAELGQGALARFGPRLPFLLKVLAAETPLSLQAHPDLAQADEGFERERQAGIPIDAPRRQYKDRNHKPELLTALGPFHALVGFRAARRTLALMRDLDHAHLAKHAAPLENRPDRTGLRAIYQTITALDDVARKTLVDATLEACQTYLDRGGEFASSAEWALKLGALYPDDIGITLSLLLNHVELEPGAAIFLPAGNLHAYLAGVGVEIMANSDNVLRGGLTPKHVDPPELARVLTFADEPPDVLRPRGEGAERTYPTPAPEFSLSCIELGPGEQVRAEQRRGPEILLVTSGRVAARSLAGTSLDLPRGSAAFVSASEPSYDLTGPGIVFRATLGASGDK
jgi:mannose-6-phosphate isomerase